MNISYKEKQEIILKSKLRGIDLFLNDLETVFKDLPPTIVERLRKQQSMTKAEINKKIDALYEQHKLI